MLQLTKLNLALDLNEFIRQLRRLPSFLESLGLKLVDNSAAVPETLITKFKPNYKHNVNISLI